MSQDPSTLFVLWADERAPLEEEVRVALGLSGLGLKFVEEQLDTEEQVHWAFLTQTPLGSEWAIWCEPLDGLFPRELFVSLVGPEDRDAVARVRYVLGIEGSIEGDAALAAWKEQLAIAATAASPGLVLLWDDIALRAMSPRMVRDLVGTDTPPPARSLYAIQREAASEGVRLRTAGLCRAGVPELEMCGVPGDALGAAHAAIEAVADRVLEGVRPGVGGVIELGESLRVRALTRSDASGRLSPALQNDLANPPAEEMGETWLLLDVLEDHPPLRAFASGGQGRPLLKSVGETRRARSLALERFPVLGELFAAHRDGGWRFRVKLAFARRRRRRTREHLWFELLDLEPGLIHGRLLNQPVDVPELEVGAERWAAVDRLSDWLILTDDGEYGPERAPALLL